MDNNCQKNCGRVNQPAPYRSCGQIDGQLLCCPQFVHTRWLLALNPSGSITKFINAFFIGKGTFSNWLYRGHFYFGLTKKHIYIDKRLFLFYNGYALNEKDIELIIFLSISSRVLQASELMLKRMF